MSYILLFYNFIYKKLRLKSNNNSFSIFDVIKLNGKNKYKYINILHFIK